MESKTCSKTQTIQFSNFVAVKVLSDDVRTSLGPRGMDKMIVKGKNDVTITNDGATILAEMPAHHPCQKMLQDLAKSQDIEAGDGTTSVVVIAGALVGGAQHLMEKGIHPTHISRAFGRAAAEAEKILTAMATPLDITNRDALVKNAITSLSSKVVSSNAPALANLAVDAVMRVIDPAVATSVDLKSIRVMKRIGGMMDDTEMIDGLVFNQKASHTAQGPTRIQNAKIGLIQFCISPPKTDMECQVVVQNYTQIDRVLREEREYILKIAKAIRDAGINVLLIQKSILRDSTNELALHFLAKMKIMVLKDIERDEVDFICRSLGCLPIASVDAVNPSLLGHADLVEEVSGPSGKYVKVTGIKEQGKTVTVLVHGPNQLMLDEVERSFHDALCVVRSLIKKRFLIPGGGAPEIEISQKLAQFARTIPGLDGYGIRAFGEALEIIPITLAENAGMNPMAVVTELRNRHARGEISAGINIKKNCIGDMMEANVIQPLLVSTSAIALATECVRMILKIDDIIPCR
nr:T-complex protein 1 subunit delta [Paratrimastix eleionoma]